MPPQKCDNCGTKFLHILIYGLLSVHNRLFSRTYSLVRGRCTACRSSPHRSCYRTREKTLWRPKRRFTSSATSYDCWSDRLHTICTRCKADWYVSFSLTHTSTSFLCRPGGFHSHTLRFWSFMFYCRTLLVQMWAGQHQHNSRYRNTLCRLEITKLWLHYIDFVI